MTAPDVSADILIVDDEPMNLMVLKGVLQRAGYGVRTADNGVDALAAARETAPDLLLLDVMMPGESGFDLCRKFKADPVTAHVPVIFVTCLDEMSDKLQGLDLGAVDYITKPFLAEEVVARVRAHLNFSRVQGAIINQQASRLNQVRTAQLSLLSQPGDLPEARFAVRFLPVLEAGGDFYDVLLFPGLRAAYLVADVSGHDLGASFITSSLKALFRQNAAPDKSPARILEDMNRVLCAITPEEVYLTAVCLVLDRHAGRYALSAGGHPPVLAALGGEERFLNLPGLPLGLFEDAGYALAEGSADPGDRFYLYTDGLAENAGRYVTSPEHREVMQAQARRCADLPLEQAVPDMLETLTGASQPVDDVVLLGVDM